MNRIHKVKDSLQQLVKYGMVGVLNTLVTLLVIFIFMKAFSLSYVIANAVGYIAGFANSFALNKLWTFRSRGPVKKETLLFGLVFAVSYLLQLVVLITLKETAGVNADISQIAAMIFYTIIGFIGNKLITFKNR